MVYKWKNAETWAASITALLTLIFALLTGLTWFRGLFLVDYGDHPEMVDETVDPVANFARFTCPAHYRMLEQYIQYKETVRRAQQALNPAVGFSSAVKIARSKKAAFSASLGVQHRILDPLANVIDPMKVPAGFDATSNNDKSGGGSPEILRLTKKEETSSETTEEDQKSGGGAGTNVPHTVSMSDHGDGTGSDGHTPQESIVPAMFDLENRNLSTQTERFGKWFLAQCEYRDRIRAQVLQMEKFSFRNEWWAFWRRLLTGAFAPLGGYRYADLHAEAARNLSAARLWRTQGMLTRRFGVSGPFLMMPAHHLLSATYMLTLVQPSYKIPAEILFGPDNSTELLELVQNSKQLLYSFLSWLGPLMMEGSKGLEINSTEVLEFYDEQLQLVVSYQLQQAQMQEPASKEDKRKYSDVQRVIVAEHHNKTMSLGILRKCFPHIEWRAFLEGLLDVPKKKLRDSLPVFVKERAYLERLDAFFAEAGDAALRAMRADQILDLIKSVHALANSQCTQHLEELMPHVKSFAFINAIPYSEREPVVREIRQMIKPIVEEYKAAIMESDWLSQKSKENLRQKVKSMVVNVGWPNWYGLDDENANGTIGHAIDRYHRPFFEAIREAEKRYANKTVPDPETDLPSVFELNEARYMDLIVAMQRVAMDQLFAKRGQHVDAKDGIRPDQMNAHYIGTENSFSISYAWIHKHFDAERLVESYGKIGLTIAHEIGHGFDHDGINHGPDGKMTADLLDAESAHHFDQVQACLIERYANECCPYQAANFTAPCVDGWLTQDENFADISGVTIAYRAFKRRQRLLQGGHFELSKRKFWVAYGDMWCEPVYTDESLALLMATDPHPPKECRVNVVTRSVPQFRRDFGAARANDKLGGHERCYLWNIK